MFFFQLWNLPPFSRPISSSGVQISIGAGKPKNHRPGGRCKWISFFSYYITLFSQHVVFTRFEANSSIETMILTLTGKTCSRKGEEVLAVKPPRPPSFCERVFPPPPSTPLPHPIRRLCAWHVIPWHVSPYSSLFP